MVVRDKTYPYPVLSEHTDAYQGVSFLTQALPPETVGYTVQFSFEAQTDDVALNQLISQGKAAVIHHLECPATNYREVYRATEVSCTFAVPDKNLRGRVEVCSFIVATQDIENYESPNFSEDYKGFRFSIDNGCILAYQNQYVALIDKNRDDLLQTQSFIRIKKRADDKKLMSAEYGSDLVYLYLPDETFRLWEDMMRQDGGNSVYLSHSLLVIPALIEILEHLKGLRGEYDEIADLRWFRALDKILKKFHIVLEHGDLQEHSSLELAQKLLDCPLEHALNYVWRGAEEHEVDAVE